ncbi:hypothetical protein FHT03_003534 [Xanthomonas arboricola]
MNALDLLFALDEVNFADATFVNELSRSIDTAQSDFEDQTRRMAMRNEDLETSYSL